MENEVEMEKEFGRDKLGIIIRDNFGNEWVDIDVYGKVHRFHILGITEVQDVSVYTDKVGRDHDIIDYHYKVELTEL